METPDNVVNINLNDEDGFKRDRPFSASMRSTASTKSVISMRASRSLSPITCDNFFCAKSDTLDKAFKHCSTTVVDSTLDGTVQGSWLVTEIDHWDMEKERIVLLTTNSLLLCNYDFILQKVRNFRRLLLESFCRIEIGDLVYPEYSVMPPREHGGARIHWASAQPSFAQRWNPFCSDVGAVTLSHHLLAYKPDERETVTFDVGDLIDSVRVALQSHSNKVTVDNGAIMVESYASIASMIHNQSHLGFNMSRGGVSF